MAITKLQMMRTGDGQTHLLGPNGQNGVLVFQFVVRAQPETEHVLVMVLTALAIKKKKNLAALGDRLMTSG